MTHYSRRQKACLLLSASTIALTFISETCIAPSAFAQAGANQSAQNELEEVVITGTRIVRDGYQAPTPLAVVDTAALESSSTSNIADYVNTMPVFAGSSTPSSTAVNVSAGTSGVNALNLRGLGTGRTLVLLDGQRSVGAFLTGSVDINSFPQQLVQRVEVVTGGASAVYGSDAVGGVANFILDKEYTGVKGEISGGVTSYWDDKQYKVSLAAGFPFAGGRGHVLLSGEQNDKDGIVYGSGGFGKRAWNEAGWIILRTPGYSAANFAGRPEYFLADQSASSTTAPGGLIASGPLKGLIFGPGGSVRNFNYGPLNDGAYMQGGDWRATDIKGGLGNSLDPSGSRQNAFARAAYDITDNINVYAQAAWSHNFTKTMASSQFNVGNLTLRGDNAFLLSQITPQQAALLTPTTTMSVGSFHADLPPDFGTTDRIIKRYVVGAAGSFAAIGTDWKWDAYFQKGISRNALEAPDVYSRSRLTLALDAVRHPTTGQIVCRSTLTNPTNGCVPYNVLGIGVNGKSSLDYILGDSHLSQTLKQDVLGASATGEPFDIWAGPVSLALSAEHRKESVYGVSDAGSLLGDYLSGNYRPTFGKYSVTEGALETVVPLAKGASFADTWDLQAAVRFTDYSLAGFVTTWKIGTTYAPIHDVRFRVTRSRDIRAPNLQELFAGGTSGSSGAFDPFTNTNIFPIGLTTGETSLKPEKADTTGVGVVLQPTFLPGFSFSADYWNIKINDAIEVLSSQSTIDLCFQGATSLCPRITRNAAGVIVQVSRKPFNLAVNQARGWDFETSYRFKADDVIAGWAGDVSIHGTATHYVKNYADNGIDAPTQTAGQNSGAAPPSWRYSVNLGWDTDRFRTSLTMRGVSPGTYNNSWIECNTGCPLSTIANRTIAVGQNHINGAIYWDTSVTYKLGLGDVNTEVFLNVQNIAGSDPEIVAPQSTGSAYWTPIANSSLYDTLGRVFRAGVRFKM